MNIKIIVFILTILLSLNAHSLSVPKNNEVEYDIIRKNKIIGSHKISFTNNDEGLIVETNINIQVKVLLITAYKFSHSSRELWVDGNFVKINAHTDFEDEREYFIKGTDSEEYFIASGMDGELKLSKNIITLNYWNKKILEEKEIFDTQKGITRKITVKKLENEIITINNNKIETEKYTLDATKNPKDKGPFPQYTLWYKDDELIKFEFISTKDNKKILTIRNDISQTLLETNPLLDYDEIPDDDHVKEILNHYEGLSSKK